MINNTTEIKLNRDELIELMNAAINAAVHAGAQVLDVYHSDDFQVNLKSDNTPLTLADRTAHESIRTSLSKTRIPLLSEEGRNIHFEERKNWDLFWLVDPLDGTMEFIKRNGEFTVNIALMINNRPVVGIIYAPVLQDLYFGIVGMGAYKRMGIQAVEHPNLSAKELLATSLQLPLICNAHRMLVASRSHLNDDTEAFIKEQQSEYPSMSITYKGSSLKLCMIATGEADIYPRFTRTWEWDTAAGQALIEAVGKKIISYDDNQSLSYNKEDLANPRYIALRNFL